MSALQWVQTIVCGRWLGSRHIPTGPVVVDGFRSNVSHTLWHGCGLTTARKITSLNDLVCRDLRETQLLPGARHERPLGRPELLKLLV